MEVKLSISSYKLCIDSLQKQVVTKQQKVQQKIQQRKKQLNDLRPSIETLKVSS